MLDGAREVNRSKEPSKDERRNTITLMCLQITIDDPHAAALRDESFDALPKIECDYAEIVSSSTGYLGVNHRMLLRNGKWLESTDYARMKVRSDAEQATEHLLKGVKGVRTADLIVQRAPVKSHACQGHVDQAVSQSDSLSRAGEGRSGDGADLCCICVDVEPIWTTHRLSFVI